MKWQFTNGHVYTPMRDNPVDSLKECPSDSWMLQWEDGEVTGKTMALPMLVNFALQCAVQAADGDKLNADWADHWWQAAALGNVVVGALGAMRHCILSFGVENDDIGTEWVTGLLNTLCNQARGIL